MQVAHEHAPPHSAAMPVTPLRIAVSITVDPISASTVCLVPSCSMKVIWGITGAVLSAMDSRVQYSGYRDASHRRPAGNVARPPYKRGLSIPEFVPSAMIVRRICSKFDSAGRLRHGTDER